MVDDEKIHEAIKYLDWYFHDDNGNGDNDAVKSWDTLKPFIEDYIRWINS